LNPIAFFFKKNQDHRERIMLKKIKINLGLMFQFELMNAVKCLDMQAELTAALK
jgi:hypothetical protein